jgi:hypothetical protein
MAGRVRPPQPARREQNPPSKLTELYEELFTSIRSNPKSAKEIVVKLIEFKNKPQTYDQIREKMLDKINNTTLITTQFGRNAAIITLDTIIPMQTG